MLDMLKRHQIQVLRDAGHSQQEVAKLATVSVRSVRRVEAEVTVTSTDLPAERERREIGRPSKAEPFRPVVAELLATEPDLLSVEILRRAKLKGYLGGKSALYDLIQEVRPTTVRPMVRFEGLPGEFTQHDFGEVDVRFLDGTRKRIQFFASRLKYSRWAEVSIVPDQRAETLVRAWVDHFAAMGGVPLLAVFDRPKTVALAWGKDGQVTEWNPIFAGVALDLGVGIEVCWPASPRQKGAVENLVGWVKGSFFKQRRFLDEADLLAQLVEWLIEVNTLRPSRATRVIPAERRREEQPRLRPLKVRPEDLALRVPVVVGPTGVVMHDTHPYSMPADAIGIAGITRVARDGRSVFTSVSHSTSCASKSASSRNRRCLKNEPFTQPTRFSTAPFCDWRAGGISIPTPKSKATPAKMGFHSVTWPSLPQHQGDRLRPSKTASSGTPRAAK